MSTLAHKNKIRSLAACLCALAIAGPAHAATIDITTSLTGDAFGNSSTPDGQTNPASSIAVDHTLNINNGGQANYAVGGVADVAGDATATGNSVNVHTGGIVDQAIGGQAKSVSGTATATGNRVAIAVGGTADYILGARVQGNSDALAADNSLIINGGTVGSDALGVYISSDDTAMARNNTVTMNDGQVNGQVVGAGIESSGAAMVMNNTVIIHGGSVGDVIGGKADSQSSTEAFTVTGNTVIIRGGSVSGDVRGGFAASRISGTSTATNNSVIIRGGSVDSVYGGEAMAYDNSTAIASDNSVTISGGSVDTVVYGGLASALGTGTATATRNTISISGNPTFGATSQLFGGYSYMYTSGDIFTGNTLNMQTSGITVNELGNFEYLNFYLPDTLAAGDTVLTVNSSADITNSIVNVGVAGYAPLAVGDTVHLLDAGMGTLTGTPLNTTATGAGMLGVTLGYEFDVLTAGNRLSALVTRIAVNERVKALSEGNITGLALLTEGGNLVAGWGIESAVRSARAARLSQSAGSRESGLATFGTLAGGRSRYNTGSYLDMSSMSLLAGMAYGAKLAGELTLGAFFEYGTGSYDTYNSFSNAAPVYGSGDVYSLGGGVLGRMDFGNTGPGHIYAELSGRAGRVHNEYSADLPARFESSSMYHSLHGGVGYIWNITNKASLDLYGKYFQTRQNGDSVRLSGGDPVAFDAVTSSRARGGARFSHPINRHISHYLGLAYEYEFDGKARATTNNLPIPAPTLRGGTGIGELGLSFSPPALPSLFFDFGVQGYVGKREGVTGSVQIRLEF